MAYERTEWQKGMVLTAENLNKIENALAGISSVVNVDTDSTTGVVTTETTTSSLSVSGTSNLNGAANIKGATIIGTTDAGGSANLTVNGNITGTGAISGGSANIIGAISGGSLTATGAVSGGDITASGALNATGKATLSGGLEVTGNSVITGNLTTNSINSSTNTTIINNDLILNASCSHTLTTDSQSIFEDLSQLVTHPTDSFVGNFKTIQLGAMAHTQIDNEDVPILDYSSNIYLRGALTLINTDTTKIFSPTIIFGANVNDSVITFNSNTTFYGQTTISNLIVNTRSTLHGSTTIDNLISPTTSTFGTEGTENNQTTYSGTATFNTETNRLHGTTTIDNLIIGSTFDISAVNINKLNLSSLFVNDEEEEANLLYTLQNNNSSGELTLLVNQNDSNNDTITKTLFSYIPAWEDPNNGTIRIGYDGNLRDECRIGTVDIGSAITSIRTGNLIFNNSDNSGQSLIFKAKASKQLQQGAGITDNPLTYELKTKSKYLSLVANQTYSDQTVHLTNILTYSPVVNNLASLGGSTLVIGDNNLDTTPDGTSEEPQLQPINNVTIQAGASITLSIGTTTKTTLTLDESALDALSNLLTST